MRGGVVHFAGLAGLLLLFLASSPGYSLDDPECPALLNECATLLETQTNVSERLLNELAAEQSARRDWQNYSESLNVENAELTMQIEMRDERLMRVESSFNEYESETATTILSWQIATAAAVVAAILALVF